MCSIIVSEKTSAGKQSMLEMNSMPLCRFLETHIIVKLNNYSQAKMFWMYLTLQENQLSTECLILFIEDFSAIRTVVAATRYVTDEKVIFLLFEVVMTFRTQGKCPI